MIISQAESSESNEFANPVRKGTLQAGLHHTDPFEVGHAPKAVGKGSSNLIVVDVEGFEVSS
jgi:hypothetical protein